MTTYICRACGLGFNEPNYCPDTGAWLCGHCYSPDFDEPHLLTGDRAREAEMYLTQGFLTKRQAE